mmetsp:Transcript_43474/g.139736  ORF Transcript_43474/g.139736 Transcript_43474/m.139736 type:complete len:239 (+) Transcript_43474:2320-3036(+)
MAAVGIQLLTSVCASHCPAVSSEILPLRVSISAVRTLRMFRFGIHGWRERVRTCVHRPTCLCTFCAYNSMYFEDGNRHWVGSLSESWSCSPRSTVGLACTRRLGRCALLRFRRTFNPSSPASFHPFHLHRPVSALAVRVSRHGSAGAFVRHQTQVPVGRGMWRPLQICASIVVIHNMVLAGTDHASTIFSPLKGVAMMPFRQPWMWSQSQESNLCRMARGMKCRRSPGLQVGSWTRLA